MLRNDQWPAVTSDSGICTVCSNNKYSLLLLFLRVWEKIAETMQSIARNTKGMKRKVATWAKGLGLKANLKKQSGRVGMCSDCMVDLQ